MAAIAPPDQDGGSNADPDEKLPSYGLDVFDLIHDSVIVWDLDGRIRYWNHESSTLYAWNQAEALGQHVQVLLNTRHAESITNLEGLLQAAGRWEGKLARVNASGIELIVEVKWRIRRDQAPGHRYRRGWAGHFRKTTR